MIRKRGNKYCVLSKDGDRNLGCYDSKKQASERLRQVEFFKRQKNGTKRTKSK